MQTRSAVGEFPFGCHVLKVDMLLLKCTTNDMMQLDVVTSSANVERSNGLCRAIEPFQKGETSTFMNHAKAGLKALMEDDRGLLVFSG